uniref:Mitochondrial antiviral-signaling protein n=1 Tax=Paramormyrops kingsleyae TaxID=1676925 RepID=A0A3B3T921_9TELE
KMPFPSDELYKGYIRRNLARFVTIVKSTEIMVHLPCLTQSDRDEIMAKRESRGNYDAMERLLDCLKRSENWPDDLIKALRSCEQWELASELEMAYESLRRTARPTASSADLNQAENLATSTSNHDAMSEEMYFSKPGTLRAHSAEQPHYFDNQRAAESVDEEPYSGHSERSEISETVQHPELEENSYESLLNSQDVRVIEGYVTEEIPVLNHAGQPTSPAKEKLTTRHDIHPTSGRADIATHDCTQEGGPSFPYNLLENYHIPLFVLAGACILVLVGRLRK